MYDVIIVGAGAAGQSAALLLGRCRRSTLVLDSGRPRNAASTALHGFLTRDGIEPAELLRIGRHQLRQYECVTLKEAEVVDAQQLDRCFEVRTAEGFVAQGRMLLLATGVVDDLPEIGGIESFYGRSVFHCPYCDGWEQRDRALGAYGARSAGLALELKQWSEDVVLLTNGESIPDDLSVRLGRAGIGVVDKRIHSLEGEKGVLHTVCFHDGDSLPLQALFFKASARQPNGLAEKLGCEMSEGGLVKTGRFEITRVPGLYVAGDASRNVQLAIVAAAEGAQAAFAINTALIKADLP